MLRFSIRSPSKEKTFYLQHFFPQLLQSPQQPQEAFFLLPRRAARKPMPMAISRRILCIFIRLPHTAPKGSRISRTAKATTQAMAHWSTTVTAAALAEPISRRTVAMAATQGVYSRVNTR